MRLSEINGWYNPSFFSIFLNTEEDTLFAYNTYSATFLHEFVHYLQDLIMPYNIRLNFTKLSWFERVRQGVYARNYLTVPFEDWDENTKLTRRQYEFTFGLNKQEIAFIDDVSQINSIELISSELIEFQNRRFTLYKYEMTVNGNPDQYTLGARDILEYIAYKIESQHYHTTDFPQLPYHSIDLIFEYYGLADVAQEVRLCIAEFCMYNDNPMRMLFKLLKDREFKEHLKVSTYDMIYTLLINWKFVSTDKHVETLLDKFDRRSNDFLYVLDTQYINFSEIRKWVRRVHEYVRDKYIHKFIFVDIYKMSKEELEDFIDATINEIGIPLVMNSKQECISINPNDIDVSQFSQFYILQEFLKTVQCSNIDASCPVEGFCLANGGVSDEHCRFSPQTKIANDENCLYVNFLKSFGLTNI